MAARSSSDLAACSFDRLDTPPPKLAAYRHSYAFDRSSAQPLSCNKGRWEHHCPTSMSYIAIRDNNSACKPKIATISSVQDFKGRFAFIGGSSQHHCNKCPTLVDRDDLVAREQTASFNAAIRPLKDGNVGGGCPYRNWLSLLPRRLIWEWTTVLSRAPWDGTHVRTPGSASRRRIGINSPQSSQCSSPSPAGIRARAPRTASFTVSSI